MLLQVEGHVRRFLKELNLEYLVGLLAVVLDVAQAIPELRSVFSDAFKGFMLVAEQSTNLRRT